MTRLGGATRYATSLAISRQYASAPTVFIATGTDFADALSAASAAAAQDSPLLLTPPDSLPAPVADEIKRLRPRTIYVLGGRGAVTDPVLAQLAIFAPTVRLGGDTRYTTSEQIVEHFNGSGAPRLFMVTGAGFADALTASAAAGSTDAPLLLVDGSRTALPTRTLDALDRWGVEHVAIAGGHGAVDMHIEQQLRTAGYEVSRHAGEDRFGTAARLHQAYFSQTAPGAVFVATGLDFPDALSAAALAGRMGSPVLPTRRECVPTVVQTVIATSPATTRFVVGGEGVVSAAAAANTPCVEQPAAPPESDVWPTTGWTILDDVPVPYSDRPPVDVHASNVLLDETDLRIFTVPRTNERADHPVSYAQYAISALMEYEATGDQLWLDRTIRHAERLTQMRTERDGAWWFPYLFPWTYYERTMTTPWWAGMAQGQALSVFVRLHETTGDPRWEHAAHQTWKSFLQRREPGQPWSTMIHKDHLFFELYAGNQPPLLVFNGHVFALFGVYDYWLFTRDAEVARYLDGAITTALSLMPMVRKAGGVSYYCVQEPYCQSPLWQNAHYHPINWWQLDTLARITGDEVFAEWAALLREDSPPVTTPTQRNSRGAPAVPGHEPLGDLFGQ